MQIAVSRRYYRPSQWAPLSTRMADLDEVGAPRHCLPPCITLSDAALSGACKLNVGMTFVESLLWCAALLCAVTLAEEACRAEGGGPEAQGGHP